MLGGVRMTENEAKFYLNDMLVAFYAKSEKSKAIRVAIKALEKQIPKKPIDKLMYLECPTCGDVGIEDCGYCPCCGQKLDWQ